MIFSTSKFFLKIWGSETPNTECLRVSSTLDNSYDFLEKIGTILNLHFHLFLS